MTPQSIRLAPDTDAHLPFQIDLALSIRDPEVITELLKHDDGPPRAEFAAAALRLGVLAIRQASGAIDSALIKSEGERIIAGVREALLKDGGGLFANMSELVKSYFDPATGQLPQRFERLLKKDGELESILNRQLGGDTSLLAQTLARHIGEESPIFKLLSPKQNEGLLAALTRSLDAALQAQRDAVLAQFSLDREDSALSRLVKELAAANAELKTGLTKDVEKVVGEFSLDNESGALARLVNRVEKARTTIADQFSLDNKDSALTRLSGLLEKTNSTVAASLTLDDEKSPLSRLRAQFLDVLNELAKSNQQFHLEVRETLAALKARKAEAARGTQHGLEFEAAVGQVLQREAQRLNDVFDAVGSTVGIIKNCKIGDHVLTLGADSAAAGARTVVEAKEKAGVRLVDAVDEIAKARENRQSQAGIFVFSKSTAPEGLDPFFRQGSDIFVVWDREDPASDLLLRVAYSLARALVVRENAAKQRSQAEFDELDRALAQIAKETENLAEVTRSAETILSSGDKIKLRTERMKRTLETQLTTLREHLDRLKLNA